jgi:hypothetical protein
MRLGSDRKVTVENFSVVKVEFKKNFPFYVIKLDHNRLSVGNGNGMFA